MKQSSTERRGVYREHWSDWVTLRRSFTIETERTAHAIAQDLAAGSSPPPPDGNPLSVTTPVALTETVEDATLFEIHVARGLPFQEGHYISFQAVGRVTQQDAKRIVRGQIQPMRGAVVLYTATMILLLLWIVAAVTSAAVSDMGSYAAVAVSGFTTGLLGVYMLLLQWRDMRRLRAILHIVTRND